MRPSVARIIGSALLHISGYGVHVFEALWVEARIAIFAFGTDLHELVSLVATHAWAAIMMRKANRLFGMAISASVIRLAVKSITARRKHFSDYTLIELFGACWLAHGRGRGNHSRFWAASGADVIGFVPPAAIHLRQGALVFARDSRARKCTHHFDIAVDNHDFVECERAVLVSQLSESCFNTAFGEDDDLVIARHYADNPVIREQFLLD